MYLILLPLPILALSYLLRVDRVPSQNLALGRVSTFNLDSRPSFDLGTSRPSIDSYVQGIKQENVRHFPSIFKRFTYYVLNIKANELFAESL